MKSSDALLYIDELSGVYNRRYLRKLKDDTVTDLILGKIPFTVAVTDIDHFKDINDLYGHITGDKAIKYYADFLKKSLRREDIIVRYGGDEFVIVQKGLTKDDAFLIWQRIIRKLRSSEFERGIRLSISVGVASFPDDGESFSELFSRADDRLYIAKRSGRGRIGIEQTKSIKIPPMKFVDRVSEMEALLDNINRGIITIVRGEAGIGKTRFLREALSRFHNVNVLWSDCLALERKIPYYPLRELIKYRVRRSGDDILSGMPLALKAEIGKVVPGILTEAERKEIMGIGETVDRYRLFEAFNYVFRYGNRQKIVVIDNVHWMDEDSLEALKYVIRENESGISFIFASRIEELNDKTEDFLKTISRERPLREITLKPLSDRFIKKIVSIMIGDSLPVLEEYVSKRSAGNSFYTEELLRALYEQEYLKIRDDSWEFDIPEKEVLPRGIDDLTTRKFHLLSEEARELLKILSVARKGYIDLLVELSGFNEGLVFDIIEEGIKKGLLKEDDEEEFVSFRAEILRQSIYSQEVSRLRKRRLHREVGKWLEKNYPEGNEEEIAYHYYMARETEKIIHYGELAGDKARKLYANHDALRYYGWVRKAMETRINGASDEFIRHYIQVLLKIASVKEHMGKIAESVELLQKSVILSEKNKFYDLLARSLDNLSGVLIARGDMDSALKYTQRAIEVAQTRSLKKELMESYNTLGIIYDSQGEYENAMNSYRMALKLAHALKDELAKARIINDIALVYQYTGDYEKALECYKKVEVLFARHGTLDEMVSIKVNLSLFYEMQGKLEKALHYAREALRIVEKTGNILKKVTTLNDIGIIHLDMGDLDNAERYLKQTEKINRLIGDKEGLETSFINLGIVEGMRGNIKGAISYFKEALRISTEIKDKVGEIVSKINLGSKFGLLGDTDRALRYLIDAYNDSKKSNLALYEAETLLTIAEVYREANMPQKMEPFLDKAESLMKGKTSFLSKYADLKIMQAELSIMLGRFEQAEKILQEAETLVEAHGAPENIVKFYRVMSRYYIETEQPDNASKYLEKFSSALETYRNALMIADYNLLYGRMLFEKGKEGWRDRIQKAIELYRSQGLMHKAKSIEEELVSDN